MPKPIDTLRAAGLHALAKRGPAKQGSWRGVRMIKYPTDPMLYAEIIFEQKPDLIIETGTRYGGHALFLADMCRLANHGRVVSIDVDGSFAEDVKHPRLTKIIGDSVSDAVICEVDAMIEHYNAKTVLVILDSDHSAEHVFAELCRYAKFVHKGGYLIAEDLYDDNAITAVRRFLKRHKAEFERDKAVEKYGIHCARDGFLKRIA